MKKFTGFITHFLEIEFSENDFSIYNQDELRRIRLVNYLSVITIFNMLLYVGIYSLIDFQLFIPAIANLCLGSFFTLGVIFFNKKGFYNTAKILLAIFAPLFMTTTSTIVFDQSPGFHVYLLLAAIIPVFMWSFKQRAYIIIFIAIYLFIFLFLEFFKSPFHALINLPEDYAFYFKSTNILACFMGMGAAIGFYQWFINKKEKQLIEQAEELKMSQKHKDIVYSIIAHDLKGPIGSFVSLTNYFALNFDATDTNRLQKIIERMSDASGSLQTLLENLLDWSKMQSGNLKQNYTDFFVRDLADEAFLLYSEIAKEKELHVKIDIDSYLKGYADKYMTSTIFRNLISNAIKFTPKKGEILINATLQDDIQVCIKDTGIGMTKAEMSKLFDITGMEVSTIVERDKGGGLGLLICKDFVECNQGRIWVESEEGKGSKFCFTIPKADS